MTAPLTLRETFMARQVQTVVYYANFVLILSKSLSGHFDIIRTNFSYNRDSGGKSVMKREDFSVMIFPFGYDMMKEVDVTGLLHEGINELEACVVGNLFNRMQKGMCIPGTPT